MAIKFSQFNESTNTSQVDFIVGYDGNSNVRISPSNFLSSLGDYLPLTGGTLTGDLDVDTNITIGPDTVATGNSIAIGNLAEATGSLALASGYDTTASGAASTALGALTTASGGNSFAANAEGTASGPNSAVFGLNNTSSSNESVAFGKLNTASSVQTFAAGEGNTVSGPWSAAFGLNNTVSGGTFGNVTGFNFALGSGNSITGANTNGNFISGNSNSSTGGGGCLISGGGNSSNQSEAAFMIGTNNTIVDTNGYGDNSIVAGFGNEIGFGGQNLIGGYESDTFATNGIAWGLGVTASKAGQQYAFGEGTVTPTGATTANAPNQFVVGKFNVHAFTSRGHLFAVGNGGGNSFRSNAFNVDTLGRVGVGVTEPTYQLQLSQNSAAKPTSNTWIIVSDERVKTNIADYTKGLSDIIQLNPKTYDYNGKAGFDDSITGNIGVIAQDVVDIFPETVSTYNALLNEDDTEETELYNFDSHALTFALINAVKELNTKVTELESRIQTLEG